MACDLGMRSMQHEMRSNPNSNLNPYESFNFLWRKSRRKCVICAGSWFRCTKPYVFGLCLGRMSKLSAVSMLGPCSDMVRSATLWKCCRSLVTSLDSQFYMFYVVAQRLCCKTHWNRRSSDFQWLFLLCLC